MRHDRQPGQRDGEAQLHPVPLIRRAPHQRHKADTDKQRLLPLSRRNDARRLPARIAALRTFGPAASMHGYARRKQWRVSCVVGACWAAGQIGKRPTQVNGCPQRIRHRDGSFTRTLVGRRSGEPR